MNQIKINKVLEREINEVKKDLENYQNNQDDRFQQDNQRLKDYIENELKSLSAANNKISAQTKIIQREMDNKNY